MGREAKEMGARNVHSSGGTGGVDVIEAAMEAASYDMHCKFGHEVRLHETVLKAVCSQLRVARNDVV